MACSISIPLVQQACLKAVIFTHSRWTLAYGTYGHILNLGKDDVMYVTLPLYHATGVVVCWCGVIAGSATLLYAVNIQPVRSGKMFRNSMHLRLVVIGELCRYLIDAPNGTWIAPIVSPNDW